MRQLMVWVPHGRGDEVRARTAEAGAKHALGFRGVDEHGPSELLVMHMANDHFNAVLKAIEPIDDVRVTFQRDSVVLLEPPQEYAPEQVTDVSMRGPFEILVEGLQSLGGWVPFLAYAVIAGAVVWAGLVSNTIFLLTASMLIAPYAAPAMTTALATARGDLQLLRRSVGRYLAGVGATAATAGLLTVIAGETAVTHLMVQVADVAAASVLLPVAAGVAGALSFGRADRTGIASGAGIGMLVALALAPQAGLMGIAVVLGDWRLVGSSAFVATLQLIGINIAASLVFRWLGVGPEIPRVRPGRRGVATTTFGVTVALGLGMIALQWTTYPELSRNTVVTRAEATAMAVLDEHPEVLAVHAQARFPLAEVMPQEVLVLEARVIPAGVGAAPDDAELAALVRQRLLEEMPEIALRVGVLVVGRDADPA